MDSGYTLETNDKDVPMSRRPKRPRNTRGPKRPMFKLSFNYSGGGGFDPACREVSELMTEQPDGTLCPCTSANAPSSALSSSLDDRTRAALEGGVMDGLFSAFDTQDPLSGFTQVASAGNIMSDGIEEEGPPPPVYGADEARPPARDVAKHVDLNALDKFALKEIKRIEVATLASPETKIGQKREFGSYVMAEWNSQTQRYETFTVPDNVVEGTVKEDGQASAVGLNLKTANTIAHIHSHPPDDKGYWSTRDVANIRLSPEDAVGAQKFAQGEQEKTSPRVFSQEANSAAAFDGTDRHLIYYLAGPDGQVRRFTYDGRYGNGEQIAPKGTVRYYTDAPPPYDDAMLANPTVPRKIKDR